MLHKAGNSKGEMPYCFPRSSIKFQGHTGQNITHFDRNWAFPDYRPVAAFKSLRFALLAFMKSIFHFCLGCYCGGYSQNGRSNLSSYHCTCWWPSTGRCQAISRYSDDQVQILYIQTVYPWRINKDGSQWIYLHILYIFMDFRCYSWCNTLQRLCSRSSY